MTSTPIREVKPLKTADIHHPRRVRCISKEHARAMKLTDLGQRGAALLHVAALRHVRRAQLLRDRGVSQRCAELEAMKDGVANPHRPFLTWSCCSQHRALKAERATIIQMAADMGIELNFDVDQVIEP